MTDIIALAKKLYTKIKWQPVPETVTQEDLTGMIADGIRHLYTMTGRGMTFDEEKFVIDQDGTYISFADTLPLDEKEYV